MNGLYSVAAYIRLSVEDTSYDSDSIENQRDMLAAFIDRMPGWVLHRFYIDNGYSGGSFDRPAFLEMIADVKAGYTNLVIVKDLSRFGRNYLEAGRYLEEVLPTLGCRFVALADGVDTEDGENDIIPFLNAMNDFHIRNLSDRVKMVLHAKARDGQKVGRAPYGFLRDPSNRIQLIVDEYAAGVVRHIFEMRRQGMGYYSIVKSLNSDGILSPRMYYRSNHNPDAFRNRHEKWVDGTVSEMLRNEIYIGNAVQLKNRQVSYRERREVRQPEEEWVRVENAFPAIVDRATWDEVQEMNANRRQRFAPGKPRQRNLFSGLLFCLDCGGIMMPSHSPYTNKDGERKDNLRYLCRIYGATAGASCTRHGISESLLKQIVLEDIQRMAEQVCLDEDAMLASLLNRLANIEQDSGEDVEKEQRSLKHRLQKLEAMTAQLYEDRLTGIISENTFTDMMQKYEAERSAKDERLTQLESSAASASERRNDIQKWMGLIREKSKITALSRDVLESLVAKIEIGEQAVVNDQKQQDIRIYYNYVGLV